MKISTLVCAAQPPFLIDDIPALMAKGGAFISGGGIQRSGKSLSPECRNLDMNILNIADKSHEKPVLI